MSCSYFCFVASSASFPGGLGMAGLLRLSIIEPKEPALFLGAAALEELVEAVEPIAVETWFAICMAF